MDMEIRFTGGMKISALYNGFEHRTDQPPEYDGEGSAPEPLDLFFVAIGTCSANSVLGFCRSRDIPTDNVRFVLKVEKGDDGKTVRKLHQEIHLPADFPEKYRDVVVRSLRSCSVRKYLNNPPEIETVTI